MSDSDQTVATIVCLWGSRACSREDAAELLFEVFKGIGGVSAFLSEWHPKQSSLDAPMAPAFRFGSAEMVLAELPMFSASGERVYDDDLVSALFDLAVTTWRPAWAYVSTKSTANTEICSHVDGIGILPRFQSIGWLTHLDRSGGNRPAEALRFKASPSLETVSDESLAEVRDRIDRLVGE